MIRVTRVTPGGQANKLGIQSGDQITSIEGSLVDSGADLGQLIAQGRDSLRLTIEWVTESGELRSGRFTPSKQLGLDVLDDPVLVAQPRDNTAVPVEPERSYGFARFAIGLTTVIGLIVMLVGLIVVVSGLAGFTVLSSLGGLSAGGGMVLMGTLYVGLAQCFSAIIDTAISTEKTYRLMESRS